MPKHTSYTDGYLEIGKPKPTYDGAKQVIARDFESLISLAFNYSHIRDRDIRIEDGSVQEIDVKVECPYNLDFINDTRNLVKLRDVVYDIVRYDTSNYRDKMYLFLRKVKIT